MEEHSNLFFVSVCGAEEHKFITFSVWCRGAQVHHIQCVVQRNTSSSHSVRGAEEHKFITFGTWCRGAQVHHIWCVVQRSTSSSHSVRDAEEHKFITFCAWCRGAQVHHILCVVQRSTSSSHSVRGAEEHKFITFGAWCRGAQVHHMQLSSYKVSERRVEVQRVQFSSRKHLGKLVGVQPSNLFFVLVCGVFSRTIIDIHYWLASNAGHSEPVAHSRSEQTHWVQCPSRGYVT